jgi:L-ascorbate metabolism protein UlaG (beta-lactamase superfamily)
VGGYVIESPAVRLYFAPATAGYPAAFHEIGKRFPGIDYALLLTALSEPLLVHEIPAHRPRRAAHRVRRAGAKALVPMRTAPSACPTSRWPSCRCCCK